MVHSFEHARNADCQRPALNLELAEVVPAAWIGGGPFLLLALICSMWADLLAKVQLSQDEAQRHQEAKQDCKEKERLSEQDGEIHCASSSLLAKWHAVRKQGSPFPSSQMSRPTHGIGKHSVKSQTLQCQRYLHIHKRWPEKQH